jgi:hypothetical protein
MVCKLFWNMGKACCWALPTTTVPGHHQIGPAHRPFPFNAHAHACRSRPRHPNCIVAAGPLFTVALGSGSPPRILTPPRPPFHCRPYPLREHDEKAKSTLLPLPSPSRMPLLYPSFAPPPLRPARPPHRASTREAPPHAHVAAELEPSASQAIHRVECPNQTQRRSLRCEASSVSTGRL